jgi:hypothetical protein
MIEVTIRYGIATGEGFQEYYVKTERDRGNIWASFKTQLWADAIETALRVFVRELPDAQVLGVTCREVNDAILIP